MKKHKGVSKKRFDVLRLSQIVAKIGEKLEVDTYLSIPLTSMSFNFIRIC